jgi:hypothetical protein
MSGQKIYSFPSLRWLSVCFSLAMFHPLDGEQVDRRSGVQGSGWAEGGFTGPIWFEIGKQAGDKCRAILEWQERNLYLSGMMVTDQFELYAGRRDLPARTSFYADSEYPPGFLPARRRDDLIFVRPLPQWLLPGLFSVKHQSGPGLYLSFRDALFFAYHPRLKIWGVTGRGASSGLSCILDFEGEKKEYQGYGSCLWVEDGKPVQREDQIFLAKFFKLEGERRPYWDRFRYREERYDQPENQSLMRDETDQRILTSDREVDNERRYRSFSLVAQGAFGPFTLLAGGMDRGDVAFRILSAGRNVPVEPGWYGLLEASQLQMQIYREDVIRSDHRIGFGVARRTRQSLFEGIFRVGDSPSIGLELRGSFRSESLTAQPVILLSSSQRADTFEYLSGVSEPERQSRFLERARYATALRIYSDQVRAVLLFTGRRTESGSIKEWGYLRLEYQIRF